MKDNLDLNSLKDISVTKSDKHRVDELIDEVLITQTGRTEKLERSHGVPGSPILSAKMPICKMGMFNETNIRWTQTKSSISR